MRVFGDGLTFDDVLIVPVRSSVYSRKLVDISVQLTKNVKLNAPIISAAMDTVTEAKMAITMAREGGLGVIHRFMSVEEQCNEVLAVKKSAPYVTEAVEEYTGSEILLKEMMAIKFTSNPALDKEQRLLSCAAIGVKDTVERSDALLKSGCDVLCLDVAHAHSERTIKAIKELRKEFGNIDLIVGNVATYEGAEDLITAGADCVKVGVGGGSTCTTRIVTGCGVPQLTAIAWCAEACEKYGATLIADTSMRNPGDLVKALAAGGDAGMFGGLFAGADEAPSLLVIENGSKYKIARGMASRGAMKRRMEIETRVDVKNAATPEGVEITVPYQGSISDVLRNLVGGLRSGMSYCNAHSLAELKKNARFVRVSASTQKESEPHNDFFV